MAEIQLPARLVDTGGWGGRGAAHGGRGAGERARVKRPGRGDSGFGGSSKPAEEEGNINCISWSPDAQVRRGSVSCRGDPGPLPALDSSANDPLMTGRSPCESASRGGGEPDAVCLPAARDVDWDDGAGLDVDWGPLVPGGEGWGCPVPPRAAGDSSGSPRVCVSPPTGSSEPGGAQTHGHGLRAARPGRPPPLPQGERLSPQGWHLGTRSPWGHGHPWASRGAAALPDAVAQTGRGNQQSLPGVFNI